MIPMTSAGAKRLRDELNDLKKNQRPSVIKAIAAAREHGDLKENAEYHAAREQQGFVEGRIKEIEGVLGHVQEIDVAAIETRDKVVFGARVELFNMHDETTVHYQLVGEYETDIDKGLISIASPIARSMLGKGVGETITVNTPSGITEYEICAIAYE